jgi:hypothetical protein
MLRLGLVVERASVSVTADMLSKFPRTQLDGVSVFIRANHNYPFLHDPISRSHIRARMMPFQRRIGG